MDVNTLLKLNVNEHTEKKATLLIYLGPGHGLRLLRQTLLLPLR